MNSVIRFCLNNKFAVWILTIMVLFAGLYSGMTMKMETMPDITIPVVTISTVYPGAAPDEVVDKITKPIEQRTKNLDGVTQIQSSSLENVSSIIIQYDFHKNMKDALGEVNEALAQYKPPEGAQSPRVSRINFNAFPVVSLSVANENASLSELTDTVENVIVPALEGIPGVATVQISGQYIEKAQLKFDHAKMASLGLNEAMVKGIVQGSAVNFPLGLFEFGNHEKAVIVDGNIVSLDDLMDIAIPYMSAEQIPGTVMLSEIAEARIVGEAESVSRTNGVEAVGITIVKASDANTVDVVNRVKQEAEVLEGRMPGMEIMPVFDQGAPIEDSVHAMLNKALLGAVFAIIVILAFLRNIRSTLIAVLSIPLSILIAMLLLKQMNVTLNIMTLGAMTVAVGRVVDDSIVVIENIYRRMSLSSETLKGKALVLAATKEMILPITSSTIVTIAVFLPLGMVTGPIGEMFMPFALTVVFALAASLLVAVTLVPMLSHTAFRKGLKNTKDHEQHPGMLAAAYKRILNWSLNRKGIVFGLAILLLAGSLALTPFIGVSLIPSQEDKMMMITYQPSPGEVKEDVIEMTLKAEELVLHRPGVTTVQYSVGGGNPMDMGAGSSKQALFYLTYVKDFADFEQEKNAVVDALQQLGGQGEWKQMDFGHGDFGNNKMTLTVYGSNMEHIQPTVLELVGKLTDNATFTKVSSSISKTYDQYRLVVDQAKLSRYGLTAAQVAMSLSPVRQEPVLTTIVKDGKELNVYLSIDERHYEDRSDLENAVIPSPFGIQVPLKDVAHIEEGQSPDTITRENDRIYASVSADIQASDVRKASVEIQKIIDNTVVPTGVEVKIGGVTEQLNETFTQLGLAMLAAVAIVYFVLVVTFGGALTPFAILFSLPFTVIGALLGLFIAGETIDVTAMIGALMLIGIVVTNAIVLISRVIHKEEEGLSVREALMEAAGTRLRPILMTALATIGALLPLALGFESGGLVGKGLGITVIGGLASSTLLTLVIVPIVYEFLAKFRSKRREANI